MGDHTKYGGDATNPDYYKNHPSGVECITIVEWLPFNLGNAVKYIWRGQGKEDFILDLKKARWYIDREILRLEKLNAQKRDA